MTNILHISSSNRAGSVSNQVAGFVIDELRNQQPGQPMTMIPKKNDTRSTKPLLPQNETDCWLT